MSAKKFSFGKDKLTYKIAIKIAAGEVETIIDPSQSEKLRNQEKKLNPFLLQIRQFME